MPDISVTDDQRERLQRVQERLAEDVPYGQVRARDALDYLLDRFEDTSPPDEATEAAVRSLADTGSDNSSEFVVQNGGTATARIRTDLDTSEKPETSGELEEADGEPADDDSADAETGDESNGSSDADDTDESNGSNDTDDEAHETRLNSVMSLLDDNDEVWREADSGEEKYEVDLPDGGTERARTKDDVRAVLFKHYR